MEKNFVKFVYKLIELSDKEKHMNLRDEFITQTVNYQSYSLPGKIEFDRNSGIVTTTYNRDSNGKLLDESHHTYQKNSFDKEVLEEADYHFQEGFFNFFQDKDKDLIKSFIDETLLNLKIANDKVSEDEYYNNYPILNNTLKWLIDRLSRINKTQHSLGREPDFNYELMIKWFNDLKSKSEYQKPNGKPALGLIDTAIKEKFQEEFGESPSERTIRDYRGEFGLK